MHSVIKMISVLTIVSLLSGAALVFMYQYANPLILENQKLEKKAAIFIVFPQAETYDEEIIEGDIIFKVKDKDGNFLGYAFLAEGNGYQGAIKIVAGIKEDLETLIGIEILESQETPGLGQEITQDKFKTQFVNLNTLPEITSVKNIKPAKPNEIEAITGATVSSSAVVSILNEKISLIRQKLTKMGMKRYGEPKESEMLRLR